MCTGRGSGEGYGGYGSKGYGYGAGFFKPANTVDPYRGLRGAGRVWDQNCSERLVILSRFSE
jgi:hypothetical protein